MEKKQIKILFLLFFSLNAIMCQKNRGQINSIGRLRTFNVFPKELWDLRKAYGLEQEVKKEMENKELEMEKDLLIKEEKRRQRVLQFLLESRPQGSSFLRDFHTSRI